MPTPTTTTTTARLVLAPDELLTLAATHERAELARYRRLAFGFLTYDTALSRLMASLGIECERRLQALREAAERHGVAQVVGEHTERYRPWQHHLPLGLVTHHAMALDSLHQALADADYSQRFYAQLRTASAVPALDSLLAKILRQKGSEHAVLQEQLTSRGELGCHSLAV
ncbi:hypothetical protein [Halomonas sp. NO4]|uniref:hypothetical protein n=1 Tax=Halomonas sp. NO4 TaxID=2484813 RepID=UPI0013D46D01|nr:hypothetical protein [Halomonas sp. NO4]